MAPTITSLLFSDDSMHISWTNSPDPENGYGFRKGTLDITVNTHHKQPQLTRNPSTTTDDEVLLVMRELGMLLITGPKDLNLPIMEESQYHNG